MQIGDPDLEEDRDGSRERHNPRTQQHNLHTRKRVAIDRRLEGNYGIGSRAGCFAQCGCG
jgi:hypothetical protein